MKGRGCSSYVGRIRGSQDVSLSSVDNCVHTGVIIHEFMHALGFHHEQSRTDRDQYVTIHWENIIDDDRIKSNFEKKDQDRIDHLGAQYDTCSVMHYFPTIFAKEWGLKTITKKNSGGCRLGQTQSEGRFSETDIKKLNTLYKCAGYPQVGGGVTAKPTEKPTPPPSGCRDNYESCQNWANNGFCSNKYSSWMAANCAQACGKCGAACSDLDTNCQSWEAGGWCGKDPDYMNRYCAKACN